MTNTMTETQNGRDQATDTTTAIRPFHFEAADADLVEMRRCSTATRFPDQETVADPSQGVQLAFIQAPLRMPPSKSARTRSAGASLRTSRSN
jgi:hypothetical protein